MESLTTDELRDATDYYVQKLVSAWVRYGKIIICVDYDQTILPYQGFERKLCKIVVDTIKEAQTIGATVILFTCRDGGLLQKAKDHCDKLDLHFDQVNPKEPFQQGYSHKPYCNIMLDDKAGLLSALEILQKAIKIYRKYEAYNQ